MRDRLLDVTDAELTAGGAMTTLQHFSTPDVSKVTEEDVAELAVRLDKDDYADPFAGLNDWHLLRAIAFHRPEMVEPYLYLLDLEAYDES
ncbi:MAG: DUF2555 domain-containing protein [Elainellaceae cyanobacterium]|jgi:hypothetical protein